MEFELIGVMKLKNSNPGELLVPAEIFAVLKLFQLQLLFTKPLKFSVSLNIVYTLIE